jgi:hypothetical protein
MIAEPEEHSSPTVLHPRYEVVLKFPVATLAPYVRLGTETLAWCAEHFIVTVFDLRKALLRKGRTSKVKYTKAQRTEFLRLFDPKGIPADWPQHPEPGVRVEQQVAHEKNISGVIRNAVWSAHDPWKAFLYLIHFEEDFMKYKGVGPGRMPAFMAWRSDMQRRYPRPEQPLTADCLEGRAFGKGSDYGMPAGGLEQVHMPASGSPFTIRFSFDLDGNDPDVIKKYVAIKAIIG